MKVFFDTVGCRLNQAEIEQMAAQFRAAGNMIIDSAEGADLVVVNSCAVTAAAASDSRQKVRQAEHLGAKRIILTGCWATLEPDLAATLPGVTKVVSNIEKMRIPTVITRAVEPFDLEPLARTPLPGSHKRTRAFIKAQDGCDNYCTFCVTRIARGKGVSVEKEDILAVVLNAEKGGTHEIVLSGANLGSWGKDLGKGETFPDLLRFLLASTSIERLRLSSTEPWDLDERFFELWDNPRMCRHLHLPLQSGSASILKRMARNTTPDAFRALVEMARRIIPGLALTTDIIVGFPGETEEDFGESLAFAREMAFAGGHVFKYSARSGTAAARLEGRVHGRVAGERSRNMREMLLASEHCFASQFVGRSLSVLWETAVRTNPGEWELHGLTDNYLRVTAQSNAEKSNQIDRVRIISLNGEVLKGIIS